MINVSNSVIVCKALFIYITIRSGVRAIPESPAIKYLDVNPNPNPNPNSNPNSYPRTLSLTLIMCRTLSLTLIMCQVRYAESPDEMYLDIRVHASTIPIYGKVTLCGLGCRLNPL